MVGFAITFADGAFRVPEDLFLDDQEVTSSRFLLFLGGAASSADYFLDPKQIAILRSRIHDHAIFKPSIPQEGDPHKRF
ncbi:PRA1 (prenylated RAB acceptor) family protein [Trifolium pratense]|uniref:PRA1 (Prenylated RAB acceptor) family protein n=1 Tax=Trifolium pratense TaxID=57577 RepID=A0A2K3JPZ9_TRIPR|nr:PRA1 (prenylated RAB acceptor) family protein [Trifolium pratense]